MTKLLRSNSQPVASQTSTSMATAMSKNSNDTIRYILKGHNGPVTCMAYCSVTDQLISGSEDGTCRVFECSALSRDADNEAESVRILRARLCMVPPKVSVSSFSEGEEDVVNEVTEEVMCVDFHPQYDGNTCCLVYVAVGRRLLEYDLSVDNDRGAMLLRQPTRDFTEILRNEDDINQISLQQTINGDLIIASCDDEGEVHVYKKGKLKVLHHGNTATGEENSGFAIATSAAFHPIFSGPGKSKINLGKGNKKKGSSSTSMQDLLISGGTDCNVKLWDVTKNRASYSLLMKQMDSDENVNQVCNPPMVHNISWSRSGKLIAASLGDGSIAIFKLSGRRLVQIQRLHRNGHSVAVVCAYFPRYVVSAKDECANDRLLISAGSDGQVLLWDLGVDCSPQSDDPSGILEFDNEDELSLPSGNPRVLQRIYHGQKPNWIISRSVCEANTLEIFVADTSNDISVYVIPRIS